MTSMAELEVNVDSKDEIMLYSILSFKSLVKPKM